MAHSSPTPAVTVMTTVFNAETVIAAAVESILRQSFADFEYVIVDDGSTDGTRDVLRSFGDRRMRIVEAGRRGRAGALNEAVRQSRAPLLANLDADDVSLPNRLQRQVRFMRQHPSVGILGSAYYRVFDGGEITQRTYPLDDHSIRREMALYGPFCHSAVMYRTAALTGVGGFDERLRVHIDYEAWIRIAAAGHEMATLPEPLVYHRKSLDTWFIRSFSRGKRARSMLSLNRKAIRDLRLARWMYLRAFARLAWQFLPQSLRPAVRGRFSRIRESQVPRAEAGQQQAALAAGVPFHSLNQKPS